MRRKVLFTASTFSHIRSFHLPYLAAFQAKGWEVHVACADPPESVQYADQVIVLPFQKKMASPHNFRAAGMLRRAVRSEGYDLIAAHTSLAAFFTRLAVKGMDTRPPVVNMVHGYLFDDQTPALKWAVLLTAERWTAPETDLLMAMNRWDFDLAKRYALGREIMLIPGIGVDFSKLECGREESGALRRELGIHEDAFVLIYPAEFSKRKSQEVAIRAMTMLPERTVLVLPGDGVLRERCEELAVQLGLRGRVMFPGHISAMSPWYGMADAAVSASRSEGLPFNVMEAMYCGLPVTASAVKGHTDLIRQEETGLLYPYGDADACAQALRSVMDSEPLRRRLAASARECVGRYALERTAPVVMRAYEEAMEKGRRS